MNLLKRHQTSCFAYHTIIQIENGDLFAFGKNDKGQCGLGNKAELKEPQKIKENANLKSIILGMNNSFLLESNCERKILSFQ